MDHHSNAGPVTPPDDPARRLSAGMVPCRSCGSMPATVQSFMYVMSFVVFTRHNCYEDILCRDCCTRRALAEEAKSALLGWWGVPWGLLTFQAIWINARTLARWSRLSLPLAALAGLAGLAVPVVAATWLYTSHVRTERAKSMGDWVSSEVQELVGKGWEQYGAGDVPAAEASFEKAHGLAPRSRTLNTILAWLHRAKGEQTRALAYAERAAEVNPGGYGDVAFLGLVLAELGREGQARRVAGRLDTLTPEEPEQLQWGVMLYGQLGDYPQALSMLDAHEKWVAAEISLKIERLRTLICLDRWEDAEAYCAQLPIEDRNDPFIGSLRTILSMRATPLDAVPEVTKRWMDPGYRPEEMRLLVRAAESSGQAEAVRGRLQDWLSDPETPEIAWYAAPPWFEGPRWREALDERVARRPDVVPSFLLLAALDPMRDRGQIHALADDLRQRDHPLAELAEAWYFGTLDLPRDRRVEEMERHVAEHPGSAICLIALVGECRSDAPDKAERYLASMDELAADNPALGVTSEYIRCENLVGDDRAGEALERLENLPVEEAGIYLSHDAYELVCAEAAFVGGREAELRTHLDPLVANLDSPAHAAAMLLRWCSQAARAEEISYRADVDAWLRDREARIRSDSSPSVQAILLCEGRVDSTWARRASDDRSPETFSLVRIMKQWDAGETVPLAELRDLAASPRRRDYAPTLARAILVRRTG